MMLTGDVLFNLMFNALASFWLGLFVALLIRQIGKPSHVAVSLVVLLLPLAKLLWDLRLGIPASSFFWASEHGIRQRLGSFQIGIGAHPWGAAIEGHLWALHEAGRSPQSIGDLAERALRFRVSVYAASVISFTVLAISLFRCGVYGFRLAEFRKRIQARLSGCETIEWRTLGRRRVRIFSSRDYSGVPFAGGFFRPYVVLPAALSEHLDGAEREAIIEHELGHLRYFDLALLLPLEACRQGFWFVPGIKWLLRQQRALLEQRADDCAVAAGIAREAVASALLKAAEFATGKMPVPVLAISREASTLKLRVQRLLSAEPERKAAPLWLAVARGLLLIWIVLGTLQASACGNHP
jgi:hypothetical protein